MARSGKTALRILAAAIFAALLAANAVSAQTLPRLHVTSLTMHADTAHPQLEKPFHLVINAHFRELLKSADFIVLPNLAQLELLGDERRTLGSNSGTDFSEVITVVAHTSGPLHVDAAFLNAIDGRDGKPKRFSSNDLTLHVEGGALEDPFAKLRSGAELAVKSFAALAVLFFFVLVLNRRQHVPPHPETRPVDVVVPPPVPVRSLQSRLGEALEQLRRQPLRANVMAVRNLLWEHAGASEGETLSDVLQKTAPGDRALIPVLRLTERAAFIQDTFLQGAIEDMTAAMEQYLQ